MSALTVILLAAAARRPRPRSRYIRQSPSPPVPRSGKQLQRAEPTLAGVTLLVVEDHADSREMLRQMLTALGARVLLAEQGAHALAILAREQPDLILLDLLMPVMDGYMFVQHVQRERRWATIPIIAVTALGDVRDYLRTWQEGLAAHLTKPVGQADLVSAIQRVLAGRRAASARRRRGESGRSR
jgi:two-component system sensor histidine kinase ChiS